MLGMEVPAVALKLAVAAPAATLTDAGTVSRALLLPSVTVEPVMGAFSVRATVQVLSAPWPRLAGRQATLETRTGARRLTAAVWELAPSVAVMAAL